MAGFLLSAASAFGHTCGVRVDGAFGPEGCGIALSGDEYEVSVTDLPFCIIRHEKHSADWLATLAPLSRLRRTAPCSGGRISFYAFLQRHGSMAKHP